MSGVNTVQTTNIHEWTLEECMHRITELEPEWFTLERPGEQDPWAVRFEIGVFAAHPYRVGTIWPSDHALIRGSLEAYCQHRGWGWDVDTYGDDPHGTYRAQITVPIGDADDSDAFSPADGSTPVLAFIRAVVQAVVQIKILREG